MVKLKRNADKQQFWLAPVIALKLVSLLPTLRVKLLQKLLMLKTITYCILHTLIMCNCLSVKFVKSFFNVYEVDLLPLQPFCALFYDISYSEI